MEKAANEITTAEEIIVFPEESVDEVKEEIKKVPSRLRQKMKPITAAVWECVHPSVSESDSVAGSGLAGMYGAKYQALAKEHEQVRLDKG